MFCPMHRWETSSSKSREAVESADLALRLFLQSPKYRDFRRLSRAVAFHAACDATAFLSKHRRLSSQLSTRDGIMRLPACMVGGLAAILLRINDLPSMPTDFAGFLSLVAALFFSAEAAQCHLPLGATITMQRASEPIQLQLQSKRLHLFVLCDESAQDDSQPSAWPSSTHAARRCTPTRRQSCTSSA